MFMKGQAEERRQVVVEVGARQRWRGERQAIYGRRVGGRKGTLEEERHGAACESRPPAFIPTVCHQEREEEAGASEEYMPAGETYSGDGTESHSAVMYEMGKAEYKDKGLGMVWHGMKVSRAYR